MDDCIKHRKTITIDNKYIVENKLFAIEGVCNEILTYYLSQETENYSRFRLEYLKNT